MRAGRIAIALVVAATVIRALLAATIPLLPDEAYYWDWSRHIAAGYFDHPPAVALLIRAGTIVFGNTALGVRAGSVLAGAVASFAIIAMALRLVPEPASDARDRDMLDDPGARAALMMLVIPGALVGFVMATPDAALLAAAALTLASLERAIGARARSIESLGWWAAAGLTLGIAFCSKYTAVLIPFGMLIALLARRDLRKRLAEPGPYVATVIALVVFAPNLVWNSRHEWISFAFQLHHGLGRANGSVLGRELALVGGQLGIVSPIIAVISVIAVARALRAVADPRRFVLAVMSATVFVFFAISALRRPVEPNWPVLALVAALPLLATVDLTARMRSWLVAGSVLGAVCVLAVAAQASARVFPVAPRRDPISKAFGWPDLARAVNAASARAAGCNGMWIAADRYQDAGELAFNLPSHPRVFSLNLGGRPNQYDVWPTLYSLAAPTDCALVIVDEGPGGTAVVNRLGAESAALIGDAEMKWKGVVVDRRAIWLVRGVPQAAPTPAVLTPAATAALSAAAADFGAHSAILDSIVAVYRRGPMPDVVTLTDATPVSSSDRRASIDARITQLHAMLHRSGLRAVYRDARYRDCTFVRISMADSTDIGYVSAPDGCRLASGADDNLMRVQRATGSWYAYAAPERRRY